MSFEISSVELANIFESVGVDQKQQKEIFSYLKSYQKNPSDLPPSAMNTVTIPKDNSYKDIILPDLPLSGMNTVTILRDNSYQKNPSDLPPSAMNIVTIPRDIIIADFPPSVKLTLTMGMIEEDGKTKTPKWELFVNNYTNFNKNFIPYAKNQNDPVEFVLGQISEYEAALFLSDLKKFDHQIWEDVVKTIGKSINPKMKRIYQYVSLN